MSRGRRQQFSTEGRGERFSVTLTGIGHQGVAFARHRDVVVFVPYGVPGETVEVEVQRRYPDYIEAKIVSIEKPSVHRVDAPCRYYGECGGCQWQHVAYPFQLQLKRRVVEEQLRRIGKFVNPPVAETLGTDEPWHYRNHARFTVNKEGRLGFVRRGTHTCVPLDECLLMHPWINGTLKALEGHCAETRELSVRYGTRTGEFLVQPRIRKGIVGLETGQPAFSEELGGHRFRVASPAFFQVNTVQAERLVEVVRRYLLGDSAQALLPEFTLSPVEGRTGESAHAPPPRALLVDAYAGVGTFAVLLANDFTRVIAVEESGPAVRDARENAASAPNVEIVKGKVEVVLPGLPLNPDAVLLDPPRAGCHRAVLEALAARKPPQVVYVSCDPATLARDLRILCDNGFQLQEVQPVDMFPQTYHIECVAHLSLSPLPSGDAVLRRGPLLSGVEGKEG